MYNARSEACAKNLQFSWKSLLHLIDTNRPDQFRVLCLCLSGFPLWCFARAQPGFSCSTSSFFYFKSPERSTIGCISFELIFSFFFTSFKKMQIWNSCCYASINGTFHSSFGFRVLDRTHFFRHSKEMWRKTGENDEFKTKKTSGIIAHHFGNQLAGHNWL